jgi:hypothetical protein
MLKYLLPPFLFPNLFFGGSNYHSLQIIGLLSWAPRREFVPVSGWRTSPFSEILFFLKNWTIYNIKNN